MNYQRTRKYFEQKNTTYPIVIAAALIAVGFIMVIFLASTSGLPRGLMRSHRFSDTRGGRCACGRNIRSEDKGFRA